jgi:hypothetical protein
MINVGTSPVNSKLLPNKSLFVIFKIIIHGMERYVAELLMFGKNNYVSQPVRPENLEKGKQEQCFQTLEHM